MPQDRVVAVEAELLEKQTDIAKIAEPSKSDKTDKNKKPRRTGIVVERYFTSPTVDPLEATIWEKPESCVFTVDGLPRSCSSCA